MSKKYMLNAGLEYIKGHLRYGHLEGTVELTDEELTRLKKDPNFAKELGLITEVDDWSIDDVGGVDSLEVFELDDDGNKRKVDMTEDKSLGVELNCFGRADNAGKMLPSDPILAADADFKYEVKDAPEQGTDKWLEWRKQGITATEAASIMFPDSHSSPMTVYTDKLGLTTKDQSDTEGYMEWGHRIEDLLINKFMEVHPTFTCKSHGRLYQRDWAKCSLDGQCFDDSGNPVIIECKTGQNEAKWNPIPDRYYAQVQWQMYVTGIRKAYFSVLIRGHLWFEKCVEYNPVFVEKMKEKCETVWNCILTKRPPATLGIFAVDKAAIAAMAGETGHTGEPQEVDEDTVTTYAKLKEAADKASEEFEAFKNTLGFKMVDASKLTYKGRVFASWVERKGSVSVDKAKLESKFPDVYKQCLKQGMGSRYIKYTV